MDAKTRSIKREIKEELHLDIKIAKRLGPVEHDYPTFRIRLIPFIANVVGGKLLLEEHADAEWITWTNTTGHLPICPLLNN